MKTPTEFPKQKPTAFPFKVIRGNASATMYNFTDCKGSETFKLPYQDAGVRKFHRFKDYASARAKGNEMLEQLERGDVDALTIKNMDKLIYTTAQTILRPAGLRLDVAAQMVVDCLEALKGCSISPAEACRKHAKRHPANIPDKAVVEVVAEFIKAKEGEGRSRRYLEDLRYRLGQPQQPDPAQGQSGKPKAKRHAHGFADAFKGSIGNIDGKQIQDYLDALKLSPRSRNNFRGAVVSLFEFAKARKYLPGDWAECEAVGKSKDNGGPIEIFTPEEISNLLTQASKDNTELVPFLSIGAFAGLRSAEIDRLEWQDVKFSTGYIVVEKGKAKTASRRVVPMPENLRLWLAPYADATGKVWPHGHAYLYEALQKNAKSAKVKWKHNALRHSYVSYRVADGGDVNRTALECGNSPQMIFSNYRELVTPEEAKLWFSIVPQSSRSRKVVSLEKAMKRQRKTEAKGKGAAVGAR